MVFEISQLFNILVCQNLAHIPFHKKTKIYTTHAIVWVGFHAKKYFTHKFRELLWLMFPLFGISLCFAL